MFDKRQHIKVKTYTYPRPSLNLSMSTDSDSQILNSHLRNRQKEHKLHMELETWYAPNLQHIFIFNNYLINLFLVSRLSVQKPLGAYFLCYMSLRLNNNLVLVVLTSIHTLYFKTNNGENMYTPVSLGFSI